MGKLIDKDKVVAEIKRRKELVSDPILLGNDLMIGERNTYSNLLPFLDTLEVKEVDLNSESAWKSADGDDLPEIDREVIALLEDGKVVFAHRPPEYWNGKNIINNEVTRYEPKRYDKGGWNQPDIKWWLDLDIPKTKMEE